MTSKMCMAMDPFNQTRKKEAANLDKEILED